MISSCLTAGARRFLRRSSFRSWVLRRCRHIPRSGLVIFVVTAVCFTLLIAMSTLAVGSLRRIAQVITFRMTITSPPRYARFGADRHQSIMRLTEPEVQIAFVPPDDGGRSAETGRETVALFVVVDADQLTSIGQTTSWTRAVTCHPSYDYDAYLVTHTTDASNNMPLCSGSSLLSTSTSSIFSTSPTGSRRRAFDCSSSPILSAEEQTITRLLRDRCHFNSSTDTRPQPAVNVWVARVLVRINNSSSSTSASASHSDDGHIKVVAPIVADLVAETYVGNATWFDVVFVERDPIQSSVDGDGDGRQWSPIESLANVAGDQQRPRHVGASVRQFGEGVAASSLADRSVAIVITQMAFHRTHLEIFGHCWPPSLDTATDAFNYLKFLYGSSDRFACTSLESVVADGRRLLGRYLAAVAASADRCLRCYLRDHRPTVHRASDATHGATDDRNSELTRRVISTVLYGDDPRYTIGAIRNAQLLPVVFPGWRLRVYVHRSTSHSETSSSLSLLLSNFGSTLAAVPQLVLDRLTDLGAELVYVDATDSSSIAYQLAPMLWRFLVIDDPNVDVFLSRDADSRLSERDAVAVSDWMARWQSSSSTDSGQVPAAERQHGRGASSPMFHCIRDHPSHGEYPVNGGMWGARRRELASLLGLASASYDGKRMRVVNNVPSDDTTTVGRMLSRYGAEYMDDMRFMEYEIWSRLTTAVATSVPPILCHDSVSCERWPGSVPFPVGRQDAEHVGQVFDARSMPRQGDVDLLLAAERNRVCEPEPKITPRINGVSCVGRSR